ncbi:two-component system response regulator [Streptomyces ovatisporus]|uniref:Two-component system response regulator n=1 Tax=Streptomyces ovatisporus TaxID=1128682 RepID=A0ABV9A6L2_9ACTN
MTTDFSAHMAHSAYAGPSDEAGILLVDDREDNLVALEAVLGTLEVPLVRATSGEEAMKALLRQEFAVVLLDVLMPGMDGFETASHIKRLDQTRDVPIIFLSGAESASEAGYAFRGYATGAADYLTKPFDPWMLRAKVSVFLELHRKNQQLQQLLSCQRDRLGEFSRRLGAVEQHLSTGAPAAADSADKPAGGTSAHDEEGAHPIADVPGLALRVAELAKALDELRNDMA